MNTVIHCENSGGNFTSPTTRVLSAGHEKRSFLFTLLLLLIPIYVGRMQELVPYMDKLYLAKAGMLVGLGVYAATAGQYRERNRHLHSISQVRLTAALFVLALISAPFGAWPNASFDALFNGFLKLLLFVYLLVACTSTEEELVQVIWAFVLSALILAAATVIAPSAKAGRVYVSGSYDPNDLALILSLAVPLIFYMAEEYGGLKKILLYGGLFMVLLVIIKTGSRGGFLALVAASAAIFAQKGVGYTLRKLPLLAILCTVVLAYAPPEQIQRLSTMFEEDYNTTERGGRKEIWKRGFTIMKQNPLLGCGMNGFTAANLQVDGGTWQAAHNAYVQIGAEHGFPGLALFILLLTNTFASLREGEKVLKRVWIVKGLRAGFFGLCVGMVFLSWAYAYGLYFMFGLGVVIRKICLNTSGSIHPITL